MATYSVVKLNFTSPLHIGIGLGDHYDSAGNLLHSDTISGAIASAFCHIEGDANLVRFMESYRLSSAFPFTQGSLFIPKPSLKLNLGFEGENKYAHNKRLKKIEYIDHVLFSKLASGEKLVITEGQLSKNGKFLFPGQAGSMPYQDEVMQRVVVPRAGGDATPFYFERRFFNEGCGLYFIFEVAKEFENSFKTSLFWLGATGFGTDKSVGNGLFNAEFSEITIDSSVTANRLMTLSLFCPVKEEISKEILDESIYSLIQRGGFIAGTTADEFRHLRKKSIYMFSEASLFKTDRLAGKIENVRPEWNDPKLHPVYKDGRTFTIPVNL